MAERKWGAIPSGATFEALATALIAFEDPGAALFGREGKDGGQDARSSDGSRVFQAKFHQNGSAASAIRDAKKEASQVAKYRRPGHARNDQWRGVQYWRLVTNAVFNPTDKETWDTEVAPLFAEQGLTADYWERENLNALLDKHPEIHRSFFEHETRVFLTIPEARERLPAQEPFLRRDDLGPFCGRQNELTMIREFLASKELFLVVHGSGGVGKTRLLVEAGHANAVDGAWQVLWANVISMASSSAWFEGIVPERPTLLLIDEPPNELILQQVAEQVGGKLGRAAHWKVVVAVRSPKDPVLRYLRGARMKQRVQELPVAALPATDAEAMCFQLLNTGKLGTLPEDELRKLAHSLSERFARQPVWLTLAVQHLEDHGHLKQVPADAEALADEYLAEVEGSQSDVLPNQVRSLLRWLALVGGVDRRSDAVVEMIGERSGVGGATEVRQRLASLIQRRALSERGAHNRLVELRPDVLRDHVLLRWLATDVGENQVTASKDAKALLDDVQSATLTGTLDQPRRAVLISLARTEFLLGLAGHELQLLSEFFATLEAAAPTMTPSQRLVVLDIIEAIAVFYPSAAPSLTRKMRKNPVADEEMEGTFRTQRVGQEHVLLALAWPVFIGAMGATTPKDQEAVLRELCSLTELEAELTRTRPHGLPNDGKRAAALVTRVLQGGPQFRDDYDEVAEKLSTELIAALTQREPALGQAALLKSLVEPFLSVERTQSWSDERSFSWRTYRIGPDSPVWSARQRVLADVRAAVAEERTPIASRVLLWHVLATARDDAQLERMRWIREVLKGRAAPIEELTAAREVWHWYAEFSEDPELKSAADELERLYEANGLAREFGPLQKFDDLKRHEALLSEKAAELAAATEPEGISDFVARAIAFFGGEERLYTLDGVAWALGRYAAEREVVRRFVNGCLAQPGVTPRLKFAITTAVSWVRAARTQGPAERVHVLVKELLAQCASNNERASLLQQLYCGLPKLRGAEDFTAGEHALLRNAYSLFAEAGREAPFIGGLAQTLDHDWSSLRPLLEGLLRSIPAERLPHTMRSLIDGVYWAVREADEVPDGLGNWLMTQLLLLPDFEEMGGNPEWHLDEIIKRVGAVELSWLPEALMLRRDQEAKAGESLEARAVSYNLRISKYVRKLTNTDTADVRMRCAIDELLTLAEAGGTVGYYLPEVLHDVDPVGFVVPDAVAAALASIDQPKRILALMRVGGAYAVNSSAWRTIALAAARAAAPHGSEFLASAFSTLTERGVRSWSGSIGEVPSLFRTAVDAARSALDAETEPELRPFWQSRLADAEAELKEREEQAKEERGE